MSSKPAVAVKRNLLPETENNLAVQRHGIAPKSSGAAPVTTPQSPAACRSYTEKTPPQVPSSAIMAHLPVRKVLGYAVEECRRECRGPNSGWYS